MKVTVNSGDCTGCELCVDTCPAVFEMADGVAKAKAAVVPGDAEEACREAASNCPVECIKIEG